MLSDQLPLFYSCHRPNEGTEEGGKQGKKAAVGESLGFRAEFVWNWIYNCCLKAQLIQGGHVSSTEENLAEEYEIQRTMLGIQMLGKH